MAKKTVQVLLRQDIKGFGKRGEIKTASLGFARNFIVPKKAGVIADAAILASQEKIQLQRKESAARADEQAKTTASKFAGKQVLLRVKAGEKGKLFGSVTVKEISQALADQLGVTVNTKQIDLKSPIKTLGKHTVPVQLSETIKSDLIVQVVSSKS